MTEAYCRIKTLSRQQMSSLKSDCKIKVDGRTIEIEKKIEKQSRKSISFRPQFSRYTFNNVFEDATQETVYDTVISKDLQNFFDGKNVLLFTGGETNCGKVPKLFILINSKFD